MLQGGVDLSYLRWKEYDGVGRSVRNGLNFTERGFGPRGGVGCSDRGHTAVSQLQPGDVDWAAAVRRAGRARAGCTPAACSARCPRRRRRSRARRWRRRTSTARCVSYDLNYRDSLWRSVGGKVQAREVNRVADAVRRRAVRQRGGLLGGARLRAARTSTRTSARCRRRAFRTMIDNVVAAFPNIKTVATTLRTSRSASVNGWGAICWHEGTVLRGRRSATSRSWTASAAAIRSRRASSTGCSPARIRSGRSSAASRTARWRCRRPATPPWRRSPR